MNPSSRQHDISQINEYLFISAWPKGEHNDQIRALDIRLILSMHWQRPSQTLGHTPVRLLWLPTLDSPLTPLPLTVLKVAALPVIDEGWKVLALQIRRHRSVMACCPDWKAIDDGRWARRRRAAQSMRLCQSRIKFEREWRQLHPPKLPDLA
jgi:hypothetical protein